MFKQERNEYIFQSFSLHAPIVLQRVRALAIYKAVSQWYRTKSKRDM